MVLDLIVLNGSFVAFGFVYLGPAGLGSALVAGQLLSPFFLTFALYNDTYSINSLFSVWHGIARSLQALVIAAVAVMLIGFLAKVSQDFSRFSVSGGVVLAGILLIWTRVQMRAFVTWRCGPMVINELVIDDGGPDLDMPGALRVRAADMGLRPNLGDPNALHRFGVAMRNIDRVIVSCPAERRPAWAMMLKGANVNGEVLDDMVAKLGAQGARVVGDQGILLVSTGPLGIRARALKRVFDICCAGGAIVVLSPLLLFIALAIKVEDGGPVLFVQKRVGRGNRFFDMYKFRSMRVAAADDEGRVSASKDDTRVTRVGRVIRRTSIDELPQLFNVLKGDMSIVGPRPHALGSQAGNKLFWEVDDKYWHRHSLRPGLSGLAQVRGLRGATHDEHDLVARLQSDLEYLEGWTILRDLKIIALTMRVLVHDRAF